MSKSEIDWVKIMEDNRGKIEEALVQAKRETEGCMQGWHADVEIDEDGDVRITELFSCGSQTMSSWEGETFIVTGIETWTVDVDELEEIKYHPELLAEFEAAAGLKLKQTDYSMVFDFLEKNHPTISTEWKYYAIERELSEYDAEEELDRIIEDAKRTV